MEKEIIVQQEVKNGLANFGLNDTERKEYENLILEGLKDKTFEKEEDLTTEVKSRVSYFIPSAKLLQQSRTRLMQENATLKQQFEDYKKSNPKKDDKDDKKDDKDNKDDKDTPDWAKTLMDEFKTLKESHENEKKERLIAENKEKILKSIKKDYNKQSWDMIDLLIQANNVDFSNEYAKDKVKEIISDYATGHPAALIKADEDDNKTDNKLFKELEEQRKKTQMNSSDKEKALKKRFK